MRLVATPALLAAPLLSLACAEPAQEPPRDVAYFLDRLHQLDELPRLDVGSSELSATWDRAGGHPAWMAT